MSPGAPATPSAHTLISGSHAPSLSIRSLEGKVGVILCPQVLVGAAGTARGGCPVPGEHHHGLPQSPSLTWPVAGPENRRHCRRSKLDPDGTRTPVEAERVEVTALIPRHTDTLTHTCIRCLHTWTRRRLHTSTQTHTCTHDRINARTQIYTLTRRDTDMHSDVCVCACGPVVSNSLQLHGL